MVSQGRMGSLQGQFAGSVNTHIQQGLFQQFGGPGRFKSILLFALNGKNKQINTVARTIKGNSCLASC